MSRSRVHVVAAVIRDRDGRVLLAQRPLQKHQGGLWEFPGGKVEPDETETQALSRELEEELGLIPTACSPLIRIGHDYPDKSVELSVWTVTAWTGETYSAALGMPGVCVGREGQPVVWVTPDELLQYPLPAANRPIVSAVRMPSVWRITPALTSLSAINAWVEARMTASPHVSPHDTEGLLLRLPGWSRSAYAEAAAHFLALQARRDLSTTMAFGVQADLERIHTLSTATHFHLKRDQMRECLAQGIRLSALKVRPEQQFTAACHDPEELALATRLGVDAVFLSPVLATSSHPESEPLGWAKWATWVKSATLPVYALGGVTPSDVAKARQLGGQGVAGISQF